MTGIKLGGKWKLVEDAYLLTKVFLTATDDITSDALREQNNIVHVTLRLHCENMQQMSIDQKLFCYELFLQHSCELSGYIVGLHVLGLVCTLWG